MISCSTLTGMFHFLISKLVRERNKIILSPAPNNLVNKGFQIISPETGQGDGRGIASRKGSF